MQGNAISLNTCSSNQHTGRLLYMLSYMLLNPLHQGGLAATEWEDVKLQEHLATYRSRCRGKGCSPDARDNNVSLVGGMYGCTSVRVAKKDIRP